MFQYGPATAPLKMAPEAMSADTIISLFALIVSFGFIGLQINRLSRQLNSRFDDLKSRVIDLCTYLQLVSLIHITGSGQSVKPPASARNG